MMGTTYLMTKTDFDKAYYAYHPQVLRGLVFYQNINENTIKFKFAVPNRKKAENMLNHWRTELKTEIKEG